jgi:putative endonuclease
MCYFYVLKSQKTGRLYKGHSENIEMRLQQHNSGKTRSTRNGIPWVLIYSEKFNTRQEAIGREKYFKSFEGGKKLKSSFI